MAEGLDKDGGISFTRQKNFSDKKSDTQMFSRKPPKEGEENQKSHDPNDHKMPCLLIHLLFQRFEPTATRTAGCEVGDVADDNE